jgi:hypothetical protein
MEGTLKLVAFLILLGASQRLVLPLMRLGGGRPSAGKPRQLLRNALSQGTSVTVHGFFRDWPEFVQVLSGSLVQVKLSRARANQAGVSWHPFKAKIVKPNGAVTTLKGQVTGNGETEMGYGPVDGVWRNYGLRE